MTSDNNNTFVVRETFGTYGVLGPPTAGNPWNALKREDEETRFTVLSPDGQYFAVGTSHVVNIFKTEDGSLWTTVRHRMLNAKLSPHSKYMIAWDNPSKNVDNFNIWSLNGENQSKVKNPVVVYSQKQSKFPETQFSYDDKVYAVLGNDGRIAFYETPDFQTQTYKSPKEMKISNFGLSPGSLHYVCYIRGGKEQTTSFVKMFCYPHVDQVITQRSSFQSDRVDIKWNKKGTAALVTTMTDVDKTGVSYYGKTALEFLDTRGEAYKVVLNYKDSDIIHASKWSPNSIEYCVIFGKMPNTRAALLNIKGDILIDMDVVARNEIYFNPQGNLVLLCGLGNLPGGIEVWETRDHKKLIAQFRSQNTTQIEWLNDGVHFITATTAPRMQVDNAYTIWDFTGKNVYHWTAKKHLFGIISFVPYEGSPPFPANEKLNEQVKKPHNATIKAADKVAVYVPIHKRKGTVGMPAPPKSQNPASTLSTEEQEKQKKIRNLQKKLDQIKKLKEDQEGGKVLEKNQVDKIKSEDSLIEQMEQLQSS